VGAVVGAALGALDEPVVGEVAGVGADSDVEVNDDGFVDFGPLVVVPPPFGASVVGSSVVEDEGGELAVVCTGDTGTYRTGGAGSGRTRM
jgi:hypothetical protein